MAKSTPTKKGATKKVAPQTESASADNKIQTQEPKKIKTVSIAKPKGLVAKVAKKTPLKSDAQVEKTVKKASKKVVDTIHDATKVEQSKSAEKAVKNEQAKVAVSEKKATKKTKNIAALDGVSKEKKKKTEDVIPASSNTEVNKSKPEHLEAQQNGESASQTGEEKLSRKERRLREWKERKKMKRLQHLQEKQLNKENPDLAKDANNTAIHDEPIDVVPQVEKQDPKIEKDVKKEQSKEQVKVLPKNAQSGQPQSKVLPLDKVGKDFPPIKKAENWGNSMSKAKVDPLQKELEPILQKTIQFLEQEIRIKKPVTILCGVSGGIDSVVLLDLLAVISTRGWSTIHIAHCNHLLRGDASQQDEVFVKKLAAKYGLHFHHTQADVAQYAKEYNLGTEVAARIMRYQFFEKAAKVAHADVIATAHHSEDNAETLLMNLMRGSGITGLAGIPPRRDIDRKLSYIRPILWLSKKEIEHYAKVRSLEWREDESNASLNFTRNKIRHELLPLLRSDYSPGLTEVLNRTTTLMREAQEFIAERIIHIMKQGVREVSKHSFAIQIGMFDSIKDFAKGELIQASLRSYLHMQPISMHAIDSILAMAKGPAGGRLDITKELFVIRDREELIFSRPEQVIELFVPVNKVGQFTSNGISYTGEIADPRSVNFGEHPLIEYFDADLLPEQLVIRHWRDGDRITPIGMDGSMTVSDFLTNAKVNVADKRKVLVLCSADEVLWIIGYRIHNGFKVTQKTESIIRVKMLLDKAINYLQADKSNREVQKAAPKKAPTKVEKVEKPLPQHDKENQKAPKVSANPKVEKKQKGPNPAVKKPVKSTKKTE